MSDLINHPPHYTHGTIEPIDVIEDWKLGFCDGNALKYIARWRHKGGVEDLKKAVWYLQWLIVAIEEAHEVAESVPIPDAATEAKNE